jgi:acetylornithine deacetylase/succinyl-diaminopimelate desuccinylase-like protein
MVDFMTMFDAEKAIAEFVRFPSVSADPTQKAGMDGAAQYLATLLREQIGCAVEIVQTPNHPVVIGRRTGDPKWPHVVIYGHYDVQPPDPLGEWHTSPFEPVIKGDLMFGRGTSDDKGPLMVHIAALANLLARRPDLPLRVTFLVEGEEEVGSMSLPAVMEAHKDTLCGDFILMSDTGCVGLDDASITTGLRGMACLEVRLKGPSQDLHSGFHGGPVMNPIRALTALCASLHDADGRVNIPGFYDAVELPEPWERDELKRLGNDVAAYGKLLGVSEFCPPKGFDVFESRCFAPTLDFNGITGGYQGPGSKTIIPARASVKISCRLVPAQESAKIMDLLEKTLRERCPKGVAMEIERQHGGDPYVVLPPHKSGKTENTPRSRAFAAADKAIREIFGNAPHYLREGGSVPVLSDMRRILGMDALMLGVALPGCNMHSPNENQDLRMIARCTKVSEAILEAVAGK